MHWTSLSKTDLITKAIRALGCVEFDRVDEERSLTIVQLERLLQDPTDLIVECDAQVALFATAKALDSLGATGEEPRRIVQTMMQLLFQAG